MGTHENIQVVQRLFTAYDAGDMPAVLDTIADDVLWQEPGPAETLPLAGTRRGRDQVADWFAALDAAEEILRFEPREFFADGETVVVLGSEQERVCATGRTYENEWAFVFTVRDGKVTRLRAYHDTAAMVAAHARA